MKKTLAVLMAALMLLMSVPAFAFTSFAEDDTARVIGVEQAIEKEEAADLTPYFYDVTNITAKEIKITKCNLEGNVTVPTDIDGYTVTSIGTKAFDGTNADNGNAASRITSITLPETIKTVCEKAFYVCSALAQVNLPDSLRTIGKDAFYNCPLLANVTIPSGVVEIGSNAIGYTYSGTAYTRISGFEVRGYKNTSAHIYASVNEFGFIDLYPTSQTVTAVTGIKINPRRAYLDVGEYINLAVDFTPIAPVPTNQLIRWTSSDETIATVDKNGTVRGLKTGNVIVTATSSDSLKESTCAVYVSNVDNSIPVQSIDFKMVSDDILVDYGKSYVAKYEILPANATNKAVNFKSADETILKVIASNGVYYLEPQNKSGTTSLTVETDDGAFKDVINVTVQIRVTGVKFTYKYEPFQMKVSSPDPYAIKYEVIPANATNKNVVLKSSNEHIAYFNTVNNTLVPVAAGTAKLTVTTVDGNFSATATAVVVGPPYAVSGMSLANASINADASVKLVPTFNPTNATNQNVAWSIVSTDGGKFISLANDGTVRGLKAGTAKIRATSIENSSIYAECTVTVSLTFWQWLINLFTGRYN